MSVMSGEWMMQLMMRYQEMKNGHLGLVSAHLNVLKQVGQEDSQGLSCEVSSMPYCFLQNAHAHQCRHTYITAVATYRGPTYRA
jgi:hypothetical protein